MKRCLNRWIVAVVFALCAMPSLAAVEAELLADPELRVRYAVFIEEMRCPKCQNQNLAGSDSPIASDLRREIRRLLEEGKSDQEITDFMVERYGDYVLYRPPLQRNTVFLWVGPGLFAAFGLVVMLIVVQRGRRQRAMQQGEEVVVQPLTSDEREQLQKILGDKAPRDPGKGPGSEK